MLFVADTYMTVLKAHKAPGYEAKPDNLILLYTGFVHVNNKSKIQGHFKDFQNHKSGNSRIKMSC